MSIYWYGKGDHPSGFTGFRVARSIDGQHRQAYYPVPEPDNNTLTYKQAKVEAYKQEIEWLEASARADYRRVVSTTHPRTLKGRGLGVHGLTMEFLKRRSGRWVPAFIVHRIDKNDAPVSFRLTDHEFSECWRKAVNLWAEQRGIADEDRQRLLDNPPDPQRFKTLRRIENEQRQRDIPVEALEPVFREQREQLRRQRLAAENKDLLAQDSADKARQSSSAIIDEVTTWFHREVSNDPS